MLNFATQTCPAIAAKISPMSAPGKTAISFFACQAKFSLKSVMMKRQKIMNNLPTEKNCFVMAQILICTDLKYFFKIVCKSDLRVFFQEAINRFLRI